MVTLYFNVNFFLILYCLLLGKAGGHGEFPRHAYSKFFAYFMKVKVQRFSRTLLAVSWALNSHIKQFIIHHRLFFNGLKLYLQGYFKRWRTLASCNTFNEMLSIKPARVYWVVFHPRVGRISCHVQFLLPHNHSTAILNYLRYLCLSVWGSLTYLHNSAGN